MSNDFDEGGMKEIRTNKPDNSEAAESILAANKRSHKKVQDIPIDDVLIDDMLDSPAESDDKDDKKPVTTSGDAPQKELDEDEDEGAALIKVGNEEYDPSEDNEPDNIIPATDIVLPPTESKFKKKRLRKNLGLDDDLIIVNGNHATTKEAEKKRHSTYVNKDERKRRINSIIFVVLVIAGVYGGIFAVVNVLNKEYYTNINQTLTAAAISKDPIINEEVYYLDSDKDGLADSYETGVLKTDPNSFDSDGDGLSDGDEYNSGTDPLQKMSDGITADSELTNEREISAEGALLEISAQISQARNCALLPYKSLVSQYPGVVSGLYEITGVGGNARLSLDIDSMKLEAQGCADENLTLFRLSTNTFKTEEIASEYNGSLISAAITSDGVYFAADKSVFSMNSGIDVMFLIDNSGSMYSAQVVMNSEENDLDFKRIALSENLIKTLDSNTRFGVAKFTSTYTLLNAVSDSSDVAISSLESIKSGNELFNGTEIADSITSAADAFSDNTRRRYIILITDGLPTVKNTESEQTAIQKCIDNHISVISISLGKQTDTEFLTEVSDKTDGAYYQAINTSSFDSIGAKIKNYMYVKREIVELSGVGNITLSDIADTGFGENDCLAIGGVPTTLSIIGSPVGSAVINKLYYTGQIPLSMRNSEVMYNLVDSEFFIDGKGNLSTYTIPSIVDYQSYLVLNNKWNFKDGNQMLQFTEKTKNWISARPFKTVMADYHGKLDETGALAMLRTITFQKLPEFSSYEKAIIDVEALPIPEKQIYYAAKYFDSFDEKTVFSFGKEGEKAFELLDNEMGSGVPSVIIAEDNMIYNAVKLSRNAEDPNEYVIAARDACEPTRMISIYITKQEVMTSSGATSQFVAKILGHETKLYILNTSEQV